ALVASALWPEHAGHDVEPKTHLACGAITVAQGVMLLVALVLPRRGTDPVHPAITGAALGMTAGAWTSMMAYLRCPHPAVFHCVLAHVIPTLALALGGAFLGHLLLKIRS